MTDPTGLSFLSYRRSRSAEAEQLIASQRERGIPTWRDLDDLASEPTEDEIRRVLNDPRIANAVLWITPETRASAMIKVEIQEAISRHAAQDGFFIVPVAAGGLDYNAAGAAASAELSLIDLSQWNMLKAEADPANARDIAQVANQVLKRRLQALQQSLPPAAPLRITLNTRQPRGPQNNSALTIDWSHRFSGHQNRIASAEDWQNRLLPALADLSRALHETAPNRDLIANGLLSLPAATALGYYFMAPAGIQLAWEQRMPDGSIQVWSLPADPESSGFIATDQAGDLKAADLAVMVSGNNDISNAVAASRAVAGPFRAFVHIRRYNSAESVLLNSAGQACAVAQQTIKALRAARDKYGIRGHIHLFTAVPAGLAMLLGQRLNTLGPIQTYEHIQDSATGRYFPAALLNMS